MSAYFIIKNLHSGFRYIVFLLLVIAIIKAISSWLGNKPFTEGDKKLNLFTLISAHTQLLIGLFLYFISPVVQFNANTMKDPLTRYFTVEHWVMMLIAIVLITIGYSKSKRGTTDTGKHKTVSIFYTTAFLVILIAIFAGHLPLIGSFQ